MDAPIGRDRKNRMKMAVTTLQEGRHAVTHYRQLDSSRGFALIECRLETGRTHQIRVHMAYIHHPLLGDPVYGPKKTAFGARSQMLHAGILGFIHPVSGEYMEFSENLRKYSGKSAAVSASICPLSGGKGRKSDSPAR